MRRTAVLAAADGRHGDAAALLQKVVALDAGDRSHLELGVALLDANRPAEALDHLDTAARLGASYVVHRHRAAAYRALPLPGVLHAFNVPIE